MRGRRKRDRELRPDWWKAAQIRHLGRPRACWRDAYPSRVRNYNIVDCEKHPLEEKMGPKRPMLNLKFSTCAVNALHLTALPSKLASCRTHFLSKRIWTQREWIWNLRNPFIKSWIAYVDGDLKEQNGNLEWRDHYDGDLISKSITPGLIIVLILFSQLICRGVEPL